MNTRNWTWTDVDCLIGDDEFGTAQLMSMDSLTPADFNTIPDTRIVNFTKSEPRIGEGKDTEYDQDLDARLEVRDEVTKSFGKND